MDLATLLGILVAGGLVVGAILMDGAGAWFINYPSLMIVLGGTMGATLINYPLSDVVSVFKVTKHAFRYRTPNPLTLIPTIVDYAQKARKDGILAFDAKIQEMQDPFMRRGMQMAVDGLEGEAIDEVLSTEILWLEERHRLGADIYTTMGTFAPAVGIMGTIIGLVQMLMQMKDPSAIGAPMAVALLTTFYGTVLANLLFLPIAGKLRVRSKQEILAKQMVLHGILAIQAGDNHRIVAEKLKAFISPSARLSDERGV
ncbi:motility protein A [Desulfatitalea alkaliphila]|uniref:MotA/TolQ/ExbB proton channel family protein n=1 Tax=Desulfatitalea alkaliphila TaxID=2929485 RepID=A0AA41R292_9BACT|nr:MotA/TolQ/ExbB proton channel family protein [Desulfatitalea alkaliphila]